MSNNSTLDLTKLYDYLLDHSLRDDPILKELREVTARDDMSRMQIAPEQGQFMALLVKLINAQRIIEIGTYTGYSSLCMARALPEKGEMICCDINPDWTSIARKFWQKAGVADKIRLHLAPAIDTLKTLLAEGHQGQFDLAFIDADKTNYRQYFDLCLQLIRPNGLILIDNVLWSGQVVDPENNEEDTQAIRRFNQYLHNHEHIDISLIPMADGITLARKR